MTRISLAISLGVVGLFGGSVSAQPAPPSGPVQRPTFSPYLNLLNRGGSPALNYLGIVRPQQQFAQQFGQLQQQANQTNMALNQAITQEATVLNELLAPTGNVATFNNTGGYFNRFGGAASFGGSTVGLGRSGGLGGASALQRPSFAGGSGAGGLGRPSAGGLRR
jgi:hypothetical protein